MKPPAYQWIGQMLAATAVAVSLGFVAFELKQSRDVAIAELTLSLQAVTRDSWLVGLDSDIYNAALIKLNKGDELTPVELDIANRAFNAANTISQTKFHLWNLGLLSEGEWEWEVKRIKAYMAEPDADSWWDIENWGANENYLQMLRELKAQVRMEQASKGK